MKYLNLALIQFLAILLLAGLSSCDTSVNVNCVQGDGARVSETRDLDGYTSIALNLDADVYITEASDFALTITAQKNIIDEITTEVLGEVLEINNARCLRQEKTVRIDIALPTLTGLEVDGSGDVYGESSFTANELDIWVKGSGGIELAAITDKTQIELGGSGNVFLDLQTNVLLSKVKGTGDLHMAGTANYHNGDVNASGNLNAFDFITDHTDLIMQGVGDANVYADSVLTVDILGSGNVNYKGTPSVSVKISGTGEVKDVN